MPLSDVPIIRFVESHSDDFAFLVSRLGEELEERYPGLGDDAPPLADDLEPIAAYVAAAPIGCGALREFEPGIGEIKRMYVLPEVRRLGVARLLIEALETQAHAKGYSAVRLGTGVRQPEAMAFYASCGYHLIPSFGEYAGTDQCVCYAKVLR